MLRVTNPIVPDANKSSSDLVGLINTKAPLNHTHNTTAGSHTHVPSDVTGTAAIVSQLNAKADASHTHAGVYEAANSNIQTHVGSSHAPSNAQKNSDITKAEIEAKLTGELTSHSHASSGLALGELSTNAYYGDKGKTAYDHSQVAHAPSSAEQNVNADWNASSGDAQILNKPTIPAAQVQTDWNASAGMGVLLNKPTTMSPTSHNNTAHSVVFIDSSGVNYTNLNANSSVGTGATQVAQGNHTHATYRYTMSGFNVSLAHVSSTAYYLGDTGLAPSTTKGASRIYIPISGTLTTAQVKFYRTSGSATTNWTYNFYYNGGNAVAIQTVATATQTVFLNTSLSQAVTAGQYLEFGTTTPAWGANQTGITSWWLMITV
jgi:hypothetical protein